MAPVDEMPGELSRYLEKDLQETITKYDKLWDVEDPEEEPYKSKYEARTLLEAALKEVERLVEEAPEGEEAEKGKEAIARLHLFLGKNLYYCEEVPTAEKHFNRSLERFLRSPLRFEPKPFVHIQDVLNQLGMLWCNRQNHSEGMNFLRRAQIMFLNRPAAVREAIGLRSEDNYTMTMFYLAQAYGGLHKPALSARFCAETMSRQLELNTSGKRSKEVTERDPFDCKDWIRNCCSLSDFFANEGMFWTAEYLMHSASIMSESCEEICGFTPENLPELRAEIMRDLGNMYSTRLKFAKTCCENPGFGEEAWRGERKPAARRGEADNEGSRLSFRCAADKEDRPPNGGAPIVWDEVFPEVVHLEDEEAHDNRFAEETEDAAASAAASGAAASPEGGNPVAAGTEAKRPVFAPPPRTSESQKPQVGAADADKADADKADAARWLEVGPGERVRLPVHFRRLHERVQKRLRRANADFLGLRGTPASVEVPVEPSADAQEEGEKASGSSGAESCTDAENDEVATILKKQPSCIGITFETSRHIFRLANHYLGKSLQYFLMDGWVTEHVRILQELSQMYKILVFWEKDRKRAAAMLKRRVRMLAPIVDILNPKVYVAFWKQLTFEVAEIYQELYELKARGKMPGTSAPLLLDDEDEDEGASGSHEELKRAARCNELSRKAVEFYGKFVESYHTDGKVPDRIDDDNARVYLTARMNRARVRTKATGMSLDEEVEEHKLALREYEWILDYGKRNPEVRTNKDIGMSQELRLCEEMVSMLPSQLSRLAARRR